MPQFLTDVIHVDATNVSLGSTTGTKIGTATSQKLAFFNSTPIIKPSGNTLTALSNLGLVASPTLGATDLPVFVASGASHAAGAVPDPGSTTGTGHFLREDATWAFGDALMPLSQATVSITGATTLSSTAFGRLHVCSGTSASYTVTLPDPTSNAGKFISLTMAPGLTKLVTIARNGATSALIDNATSRIMWANETATLLCDGTHWIKIAGKSIPMSCVMYRAANATATQNTDVTINIDTVTSDNTGLMADTTVSFAVKIARPSTYVCLSTTSWAIIATVNCIFNSFIMKNGVSIAQNGQYGVSSNYVQNCAGASPCVVNDLLQMHVFQSSNASVSQTVNGGSNATFIQVNELVSW